jgi:hypothetical protein
MRTRQQRNRQNNVNNQQVVANSNIQSPVAEVEEEQIPVTVESTTPTTTTTRTSTRARRKSESSKTKNTTNNNILNRNARFDLKKTLKKATTKFNRACKQILKLDQKINDLQNSYTNAIETDRKTFKIVYRMQLATLEGLHEAYIEYIEKKVNEIRDLKNKIFGADDNTQQQQDQQQEPAIELSS